MLARTSWAMCVLLAGVAATTPASAGEEPKFEDLDPSGKPKDFKAGLSTRYAIWHDGTTWHFRTTTAAKESQEFSGTIEVIGGKMTALNPVKVEGKKAKKNKDFGSWNPEGTRFKFSLTTAKGFVDGFDLQLSDKATALKLVLKVNGEEAPKAIFLGAKNAHPTSAMFFLPARPGK
jgi:hypothetical protein